MRQKSRLSLLLAALLLLFQVGVQAMLIMDTGRSTSQGLTFPQTDYPTSSAGDVPEDEGDEPSSLNTHLGTAMVIGGRGLKRSNESYRLQLLPSSVNPSLKRLRFVPKSGNDLAALYRMYNNLKRGRDEHIPCHFKLCHDDVEKRLSF